MLLFDEYYARLNPRQKEAVDAIEGPVMVIAGPGTGKTSILTLRIANILKKTDTPPSGILALTFTESGVKAMQTKLRELIGSRAHEVRIHTYHSFAASVISEFEEHFSHIAKAQQMTEIESEIFIRDILKNSAFSTLRPLSDPDLYIYKILKTISESKKEAWTPEMVRSFAKEEMQRIQNDESSISSRGASKGKLKADAEKRIEKCEKTLLFADVYELYEKKKVEEKKIDFDDLIFELMNALKRDELLKRLIQEKFLYVLVDEHQDTNDSQNEIIRLIADFFDMPNLFVVGDEKQAIYRFQGASVQNFLLFQNVWKDMKVISLENNYRSHQSILDASFSMIEGNYEENEHLNLRIKLKSGSGVETRPVEVITAGNTQSAEEYLMSEVKSILEKDKEASVAIIVRTNREIERLIELFGEHSIHASAERGVNVFTHPLGILFFELMAYCADSSQVESLAQTLAFDLWGIPFERRALFIKKIRSGDILGISEALPALSILQKELLHSGALSYLIRAADLSGLTTKASRDHVSAEVWRSLISLATDIASRKSIGSPQKLIEELLAYKKSAEIKNVKISVGKPASQVSIMTAHGSKGLEYDYVFIPYATEESWMPKSRGVSFVLPRESGENDEVKDARRLFYVALTRARRHVVLISSLMEGTGRELAPLRFIEELDQRHIKKVHIPASDKILFSKGVGLLEKERQDELKLYAQRMLLEKGLSVTALNHFMDCPNAFFYKSILKLPEPPTASSEKGNAMHEAISYVWRLTEKTEEAITDTIITGVRSYFKRSLLPAFEKQSVLEELVGNAPIVAKALFCHFSSPGTVLSESWVEMLFSGAFKGEEIAIKLHGKLDAMVETDTVVSVYDYKTREALSITAIKGETKNSDGSYFRQLIFYKMLLGSKPLLKEKSIEPALVFVKPDDKGRCPIIALPIEKSDLDRVQKEINYLIEDVWSGKMFERVCDDRECKWCSFRKKMQ